ncbi:GNAT family N-acetyltransferase [Microvirga antarctica]|uniref:GNAT family N-acetyltransferase n=1 Tax=Microvirga antarctica TaxID=2819233 RepID=UPI001B307EB6|nr:GNAT family N-acetyltransferase [Microvirga antarctica]
MSDLLVSIRRAKTEDSVGLSRVFDASWREAYQGVIPGLALEKLIARRSAEWWRSAIGRGRPLVVLDVGEGVVGYVSYGRCRNRGLHADGEIDELYLTPEYQGVGYGKRLFKAVRNDLRDREMPRVAVWALADNPRARGFYESLGGRSIAHVEERIGGVPLAKIAYLFT